VRSSPVRVLAGTTLRLEVGDIVNTNAPGSSYEVTVTTKTSSTIIDGPTSSSILNIKKIETNDISTGAVTSAQIANGTIGSANIADNAITSSRIANSSVTPSKTSFMTFHKLVYGQDGWTPNCVITDGNPPVCTTPNHVSGADLSEISQTSIVLINIQTPYGPGNQPICVATNTFSEGFDIECPFVPNGSLDSNAVLKIAVLNPP
jgi:hypothetical protein